MKTTLKTVAIADIIVSASNPRKHFDAAALQELSESIKQFGVLQPVLLRPQGKKFELVCGERRYRASIQAGLTELPAQVRELTDDQAFEVQIIENLERKDVHPMDEAEAFKKMIDSGRYTIPDIAAKLAKAETFVAQRLKLNDLVPEMQVDFFNGEMSIGHAVKLARLSKEEQVEILNSYKNRTSTAYGTVKDLENEIKKTYFDLGFAAFSLDKDYSCAASCTICPKRTKNNIVLFPEMMEEDNCMDKACYRAKTDEHIVSVMNEKLESGENIVFGHGWNDNPGEAVKEIIEKEKIKLLKEHDSFWTYKPGGYDTSEAKLLYVSGVKAGTLANVHVKNTKIVAATANPAPETYSEIDRIKDRAKRDLELDKQKVQLTIVEKLEEQFNTEKELPFAFPEGFQEAMFIYLALNNSEWWIVRQRFERMGYNIKLEGKTTEEAITEILALTEEQRIQLLSAVLFRKCKGATSGTGLHSDIIRQLAIAHPDIDVDLIEAEQEAIAKARIIKTNAKLAELEKLQKPKSKVGQSDMKVLEIDVNGIEHIKE